MCLHFHKQIPTNKHIFSFWNSICKCLPENTLMQHGNCQSVLFSVCIRTLWHLTCIIFQPLQPANLSCFRCNTKLLWPPPLSHPLSLPLLTLRHSEQNHTHKKQVSKQVSYLVNVIVVIFVKWRRILWGTLAASVKVWQNKSNGSNFGMVVFFLASQMCYVEGRAWSEKSRWSSFSNAACK